MLKLNSKEIETLEKLSENYDAYYEINKMPKNILIGLLFKAIDKIDYLMVVESNEGNYERDWKDTLCDKKWILIDILEDMYKDVQDGFYEKI